jgi:dihydrofolate reductase
LLTLGHYPSTRNHLEQVEELLGRAPSLAQQDSRARSGLGIFPPKAKEAMAITGIVAVDRQGAIGKGGRLPWHYSSDLKFFKSQTTGAACVMGHRTWESLKRPLPNRLNIILSRTREVEPQPGVITLRDKQEVLSLVPYLNCDLFIIGGAQIFLAFSEEIEKWIVTEVPLTVEDADTFMPKDFLEGFSAYESRQLEEDLKVTFYEREK